MSVFARMSVGTTFVPSGCWVWNGYVHEQEDGGAGYRVIKIDGVMTLAHRWSYEFFKGPIPEDYVVDHLCRVRRCWNPTHLEAVTVEENNIRAGRTNRHAMKTHCINGHEFSAVNTYQRRYKSRLHRMCKKCMAASQNRNRATRNAYKRQKRATPTP